MRMLGIDPASTNASGAVYQALNTGRGAIVAVFDVPVVGEDADRRIDVIGLVDLIQTWGVTHATIERVWAMPMHHDDATKEFRGMSSSTAFKFGFGCGSLQTTVRCCGIEPRMVVPQKWKKFFNLKGSDKEDSRQLALDLFPNMAEFLQLKKNHGRAEAMLLARYGAHAHSQDAEIEP